MGRSLMSPAAAAPLLLFHAVMNDSRSRAAARGNPRSGETGRTSETRFQRAEMKEAKRRFDEWDEEDSSWKPPRRRGRPSCYDTFSIDETRTPLQNSGRRRIAVDQQFPWTDLRFL